MIFALGNEYTAGTFNYIPTPYQYYPTGFDVKEW